MTTPRYVDPEDEAGFQAWLGTQRQERREALALGRAKKGAAFRHYLRATYAAGVDAATVEGLERTFNLRRAMDALDTPETIRQRRERFGR